VSRDSLLIVAGALAGVGDGAPMIARGPRLIRTDIGTHRHSPALTGTRWSA
jgi:hypothetical protein